MSDAYVLVLSAPERGKQIPVIIGETEAQAIVMAIEHLSLKNDYATKISAVYIIAFFQRKIKRETKIYPKSRSSIFHVMFVCFT